MEKQQTLFYGVGVVVISIVIGVFLFYFGEYSLPPAETQQSAVMVPFTTLAKGSQSDIYSRVNYLITTQEELVELWTLLKEPPPIPTVDFNTRVVVAVFSGEAPTAGYDISVAEVKDEEKRVVKVELTKPDESCVLAPSLTAPYQIVKLPKTFLPFTHADIWTTKSCP